MKSFIYNIEQNNSSGTTICLEDKYRTDKTNMERMMEEFIMNEKKENSELEIDDLELDDLDFDDISLFWCCEPSGFEKMMLKMGIAMIVITIFRVPIRAAFEHLAANILAFITNF